MWLGDFKMRSNSAPPNYVLKNNIWGPAPPKQLCSGETFRSSVFCPVSNHALKPSRFWDPWSNGHNRQTLFHVNSVHVFPVEPQKVNPSSMQETYRPSSKHYHLKNAHNSGFELGLTSTNDPLKDRFTKKQHFIRGKIPGGSASNKMIYGTDELLRQAKLKEESNPSGFLYGTEAATKVGKPAPAPRPNNMIWLEERTERDAIKNKELAMSQDEFLARHKEEKQRMRQALQEEKRRDLEDLKRYNPWGRPGNGAPNMTDQASVTNHVSGSEEKPETKRTKNVKNLVQESYQPFGGRQGGGGAPNRTESGRVAAGFRSDPELRFPRHASKANVEPLLRYGGRDERYKQELDSMIEGSRTRKLLEREKSIEDELHHINTDPFGKEGAGAPRKTGSGTVKASFPTTLSKDIEELRQRTHRNPQALGLNQTDPDEPQYNPWGRGHGNPPMFDRQGRIIKPARGREENDLEGIGIEVKRPGAGAPNIDKTGNLKIRKGQTLTKSSNGQTIQRDFSPVNQRNVYDPFGRPGAGAPIKDPEGQIQTRTAGKVAHDSSAYSPTGKRDVAAKQEYLTTLQKMSEGEKQRRKAEHEDLLTSEKDVASWLRSGVVGQPSYDATTREIIAQKKHTSDVTSQALNIRRLKNEKSREYHTDLEAQAQERYQKHKQSQEEQRVKSVEHVKTMDHVWGRPGAGAPLRREHMDFARKQKLGLVPADSSFTYRDA
ncbi:uncharacterized protein LOC144661155 isoform X1 [Oculina patagonica]